VPPPTRSGPAWALLAPAFVVLAVWWGLPLGHTLWSGLADLGSITESASRTALRNTVVWLVVVPVGATGAGLGLAWLAHRLRAQRLLVPIVALPALIALVVVAVAWRSVLAFRAPGTAQVGLLNQIVALPGLDPVAWTSQAPLNTVLLAGALVWVQAGIAMLVLSVAIDRVPDDTREAALLDGASDLQAFRFVTLPNIRGAIALAAVTSAAAAIKVFDIVVVATDGQHATQVLGTESMHQALRLGETGSAAALAVVMLFLMAPFALWALARSRRALDRAPSSGAPSSSGPSS
jgi:alpha-glucoside transport system permease protein